MAEKTSIEWCRGDDGAEGASWNPIRARSRAHGRVGWHCEHVSEGCRHCYAEGINNRLGTREIYVRQARDDVEIFIDEKTLLKPLGWRKPRRIFVCSMTDLFGEWVTDEQIDRVFAIMALCPRHTFIVLTKRPERMRRYLTANVVAKWILECAIHIRAKVATPLPRLPTKPLPNVWLGVSVEDQPTANERLPHLRDTPSALRLVSYEPALGPVDLTLWLDRLDWVICGGESGPDARPMHPDWVRSVRDQCIEAGVAFFFKQWGAWHVPNAFDGRENIAETTPFVRVGKKAAGRVLDGREWNEFPQPKVTA